jgi:osmotically-inducible protein OsmY
MLTRITRWAVAAFVGSVFAAIGCTSRPAVKAELEPAQRLVVADESVVHALDTSLETRLIDRIELDTFLRDRDIQVRVVDGVVQVTGEVWTPLEKERVGELVRSVAGVVAVDNELDVHSPRW